MMEWINLKAYGIKNAETIEKACGIENDDSMFVVLEKFAKFIKEVESGHKG